MIPFRQIIKELFAERTRIFLTIFAVAWGTAAITTMLAVGEGLRLTFGRAMLNTGDGILVVRAGETSVAFHGHKMNEKIKLFPSDLELVKKSLAEYLQAISVEYTASFSMQYASQFRTGSVTGVEPSYGTMRNVILQPGGRFINDIDIKNNRRVIVLGAQVAEQLFADAKQSDNGQPHKKRAGIFKKLRYGTAASSLSDDALGKTVLINHIPFLVIGVAKSKLQFWNYAWPQDDAQTWVPASTFFSFWHPQVINDFIALPNARGTMDLLTQRITRVIGLNHGVSPDDPAIIQAQDSQAIQDKTNVIFSGMEIFLGTIGALTLLIAGIGIANVMYVAVSHATREIGIRMTVGARSYQVLAHYIVEAMLTTLLGGIIGILLSFSIVELIHLVPMNSEFFTQIGKPKPILSKLVMFTVIFILGLIGFLAGFFPARKASLINPAEALRYE